MAEVVEISDGPSLKSWVDDFAGKVGEDEGRRAAVAIAHRATMRLCPEYWRTIWLNEYRLGEPFPLTMLRQYLVAGVASAWPTPKIRNVAASAAAIGAPFVSATDDRVYAGSPSSVVNAAAGRGIEFAIAAVDNAAYDFTEDNADSADQSVVYWRVISKDISGFSAIHTISSPLWRDERSLSNAWKDVHENLSDRSDAADWRFWIDWYEDALAGRLYRPENEALLTRIALIPDEDWKKGAGHVARLIEELRADHAVAASPNAERIVLDEAARRYRAEPVRELSSRALEYAQAKLQDALKIIDVDPVANNLLGALAAERDLLRQALAARRDHPAALFDTCLRIIRRVNAKIENGDVPAAEKDADIGDFLSQIHEVALDLLADPEVKALATHRALLRMERATQEDAAALPMAAEGLRAATEPQLAEELSADAQTAVDPSASEKDRREAIYRFGSRLVRIYAQAKKAGKETILVTGGVAALCGSIGVVVKNAEAVETAFAFCLRLFGI